MAYPFDKNQYPLNAKPKRAYATLADWENWVGRLTRYELDQLYPGMLKNVIATYEVVMADEEKKVATHGPFVQNDGPNFDKSFNDPAVHPGLVSSGFGTSGQKPSGFGTSNLGDTGPATDFEKTGFGGSVYGSMEGYKGFGSSGSKSTKPNPPPNPTTSRQPFDFASTRPAGSTLAPTGFGITPPVPAYTPYTPPVLPQAPGQPFQFGISAPTPQPPVPGPAVSGPLLGAPAFAPPPRTPHWSAPVAPFAPPKAPQQALRPFPPAPFSPAPMPAPLLAPTGTTKRKLTPPGWRPMGLLDMNYVRQPKVSPSNRATSYRAKSRSSSGAAGNPGGAKESFSQSLRRDLRERRETLESAARVVGFLGKTALNKAGEVRDRFTEAAGEVYRVSAEGVRYVNDFATTLIEAPSEDQLEFLMDFVIFLGNLSGVGEVITTLNRMIRDPEERTVYNVSTLMLTLLPIVRVAKAGPKLYRFIDKGSKKLKAAKRRRGARNGKRPADTQRRQGSDRQMRAKGGEHGGRRGEKPSNRGNHGIFTNTPRLRDFVYGGVEAVGWEAFDQFFSANILPIQSEPGFSTDSDKFLVAFLTGGLAGVSSSFESEGSADIVVQSIIDPVATGLHTWLMRGIDDGDISSKSATMAGGIAVLGSEFAKLAKILLFTTLSEAVESRLSMLSPGFRRWIRRQLKIAIHQLVDKAAEYLIARLNAT
jgi:hypothetical protein